MVSGAGRGLLPPLLRRPGGKDQHEGGGSGNGGGYGMAKSRTNLSSDSNINSNSNKYLHLVIPAELRPGGEEERRDGAEEEQEEEDCSMAQSGHTLDRFGDLVGVDGGGGNKDDEGDDRDGPAAEEENAAPSEQRRGGLFVPAPPACEEEEQEALYDDEGRRVEVMYDDEGNRVERVKSTDWDNEGGGDIIWQDDDESDEYDDQYMMYEGDEEEETESRPGSAKRLAGLPPLPPPRRGPANSIASAGAKSNVGRSSSADIRERFNRAGQSWQKQKQHRHSARAIPSDDDDDRAELELAPDQDQAGRSNSSSSASADIRERFNRTGQSWLRTQQQLRDYTEVMAKEEERKQRRDLYLSDSDSTEVDAVVREEERPAPASSSSSSSSSFSPPQIAAPAPTREEQRHVRFANVVDTRVYLVEEEVSEDPEHEEISEEDEEEPQCPRRCEEAACRVESKRRTLHASDEDMEDNNVEESEMYITRKFDDDEEGEDEEDFDAEEEGSVPLCSEVIHLSPSRGSSVAEDARAPGRPTAPVMVHGPAQQLAYGLKPSPQVDENGGDESDEDEGGSFYFLESPTNGAQLSAVAPNEKSDRSPPEPQQTQAKSCISTKPFGFGTIYDGNVDDVGSILDDLQGIESEMKNRGKSSPSGDVEEDTNAKCLDGDDDKSEASQPTGHGASASSTKRDCMQLNDDVLRSYQLMKEREERQLEAELQETAITNQRSMPEEATPPKSLKVPDEMRNPRFPYRHGHSLGDEVSDIFSDMSSLGPWAVSRKMDKKNSQILKMPLINQHDECQIRPNRGNIRNSELSSREEGAFPNQGLVRQEISLDETLGNSFVGKMLTLVPSPRANPSTLSTPVEEVEDGNPKKSRWPFGKKKKHGDSNVSKTVEAATDKEQSEDLCSFDHIYGRQSVHRHKNGRGTALTCRDDSILNYRKELQALYESDRCRTGGNQAQTQYGEAQDSEYYQWQIEENSMQLHMAADYAVMQLIQNEQQRRAKKQDMFRQEMEERAREEEEALRQQEAAVLQAIKAGNQDDIAAILTSTSQWAPDVTSANASENHRRHPQQKTSSFLQSFFQGELCTSENAKFIEGKAKQIADVLRETFDDDSVFPDTPKEGSAKYMYEYT